MFVEKLSPIQILDFLKNFENYKYASSVNLVNEATLEGHILFTVDFLNRPQRSISKVITATDTRILFKKDENWIKYLYSIFGEDYKRWYKKKQEEEYKRLFSVNEN